MPLTPFSQNSGNQMGGGLGGFDPMTGRPNNGNQQRGFQIPPPLGQGLGQLGAAEQAYTKGMQQFAGMQQQQQEGGFEMPPPQGGPLTYQSPLGQTYQLDPNAAYTMGMGGKPKRAQMI